MNQMQSGIALISVLAIMSISMIIITVLTVVATINGRMINDRLDSQKAYETADMLADDAVLKFIRYREFTNPYINWTSNCLQIPDLMCKMELNLNASGGIIRTWGKSRNSVRQLEVTLNVLSDDSVTVVARKEIY